MASSTRAVVIDLDVARVRRLTDDLAEIEAWARAEGRRSRCEARWLAMRAYAAAEQDPQAEGFRVRLHVREGAEGAFEELEAHLRLLRGACLHDGLDPRARYRLLRDVAERQRAWCGEEGARRPITAAHAFAPAELRALGRVRALREMDRRLRALLRRHPTLPGRV